MDWIRWSLNHQACLLCKPSLLFGFHQVHELEIPRMKSIFNGAGSPQIGQLLLKYQQSASLSIAASQSAPVRTWWAGSGASSGPRLAASSANIFTRAVICLRRALVRKLREFSLAPRSPSRLAPSPSPASCSEVVIMVAPACRSSAAWLKSMALAKMCTCGTWHVHHMIERRDAWLIANKDEQGQSLTQGVASAKCPS